jgi:hypothetical protein
MPDILDGETVRQKLPEKEVGVRPTLYIGLGGTGKEILLRLRRRILNADWKDGIRLQDLTEFPIASFLYFDLDTTDPKESDKSVKTDPLADTVAFQTGEVDQERLNLAAYTGEMDRHRLIKEWWPKANVERIDPEKGAGQVRPVSRLHFFSRSDDLREVIRQKGAAVMASLTNEEALQALGLRTQPELRIVVVTSVAGGTGSGCFIDMGYLIGTVFPDAETNLLLLLPSVFYGAGKERVSANGYAALMELEYCMRGNRYVEKWTEHQSEVGARPPYKEVYLLDISNMAGEATRHAEDLYSMIADTLFEDYGSGEFAASKRSVAVNQQKHKNEFFRPELGAIMGGKPLIFSRVYSSFGQATIDTQSRADMDIRVARLGMEMIRAFFRVSENDESRVPKPEELYDFMKNHLSLGKNVFEDFTKELTRTPAPVMDYAIVDSLLLLEGSGKILASIEEKVNSEFAKIQQSISDRKDWPQAIDDIKSEQERQVQGAAGAPEAALRYKQIKERRHRIHDQWFSDGGLRYALYKRLDDKQQGGLDYTITLIQHLKDALDNWDTGVIKTLEKAHGQYLELADLMLQERYLPFMTNLKETVGFDLIGSKKRHAEIIVQQISEGLYYRLLYLTRARACTEAASLIRELSDWLGESSGLDDQGEPIGTGLVKEFLDGQKVVQETLDLLSGEIKRLEDYGNRTDVVYLTLKDDRSEKELHGSNAERWAQDAFNEFGGSQELFGRLQSKTGRDEVVSKLRAIAEERIHGLAGEGVSPSFLQVFARLSPQERLKLLKKLLTRAMPWINADLSGNFNSSFSPDQFRAYLAVKDGPAFAREYDSLLDQIVPPGGLKRNYIQVVDSGVDGRMICYIELSGIPLDVIRPLRGEWLADYRKEMSKGLPLHNHKDFTRFPQPLVPTSQEVRSTMQNIRLFLEGVGFGILRRRKGEDAYYEIEADRGEWQSVGNERAVRSMGFGGDHHTALEQQLQDARERIKSPYQRLALEMLFKYYADRVYRPVLQKDNAGVERRVRGLTSLQALELSDQWKGRLERMDTSFDVEKIRNALQEEIPLWTSEINGTHGEFDAQEVDTDEASPKIAVKKEFFDEGWLDDMVKKTPGGTACPDCGKPVQNGFKNCPHCGGSLGGCPSCGKPVKDGFKVCPYCGGPLQNKCPKCGSATETGWAFCPVCATHL